MDFERWGKQMVDNEFKSLKEKVKNLIKGKREVTSRTKYKIGGIYMLYVDNFEDDKIIPFYIGQASDIQDRHKSHMKEIFSINRLDSEFYEDAVLYNYYEGNYKSCKIFKYLIEHECTLKDVHMVILEECEDEHKRLKLENWYIDEYLTSYFGFNQINSITLPEGYAAEKKYFEKDILNIKKYINYGFNKFNYLVAKKIFEYFEPNLLQELRQIEEIRIIDGNVEKEEKFDNKWRKLKGYVNSTAEEECKELCGKFIDTFFQKNGLKSEEKKKQVIDGLIYNDEKNKMDVTRYITRFSSGNKEDIFKVILESKNGNEVVKIAQKVEKAKKEMKECGYNIDLLRKEAFKYILPNKKFEAFRLKDSYVEKDIFEDIRDKTDNIIYINIEFSNHGRRWKQDDYPCEVKIDYLLFKDNQQIRKSYYLESEVSKFFSEGYRYVIETSMYNLFDKDPFKIGKRGGKTIDYSTISTSMEYENGINEFTLKDKETYKFQDIIREIDRLINKETKVIYTSGCKSLIRRWENCDAAKEGILIKKLIKSINH